MVVRSRFTAIASLGQIQTRLMIAQSTRIIPAGAHKKASAVTIPIGHKYQRALDPVIPKAQSSTETKESSA